MNRIFFVPSPEGPERKKYSELRTQNSEQLRTRFSRKTFHKKTENWEQLRTHIPRITFRKKLRTENN